MENLSTKERLRKRLADIGLGDLSVRAGNGEFSDYESDYPLPKTRLVSELLEVQKHTLSIRKAREVKVLLGEVRNGLWDDTREEAGA